MTVYVTNAFSLQMLAKWRLTDPKVETELLIAPIEKPIQHLHGLEKDGHEIRYAVGHEDTARYFSQKLLKVIKAERMNVELSEDDVLLVGQFTGGRLPEGATTLPPGVEFSWVNVTIVQM